MLGRKTTIGRTPDNDLQIDAKFISRHHAVILAGPAHTIIEDLNSTNGVHGQRPARHPPDRSRTATGADRARRVPLRAAPAAATSADSSAPPLSLRGSSSSREGAVASPYIEKILKARVYDVAIESPLEEAPRLSRRLGNQVLLKREDLQPVFSFKLRGAYNRIAHLSEAAAPSAAWCAPRPATTPRAWRSPRSRRGIPAVVVMPQTTPHIKVQAVIDLGAEVVLHGDDYDSGASSARCTLARERNLVFVHPFDDPDVIAGQGTIGVEILRQTRRQARCDLRAGRRRRPDRRHRRVREIPVSRREDHRRRAGGCRRHVRLAQGRASASRSSASASSPTAWR